jgi:hypothetical protein
MVRPIATETLRRCSNTPEPDTRRLVLMQKKFTASETGEATEERVCACNDGFVTVGYIALDPETGEEVEQYGLYPCEQCKDGEGQ